MKILILEDNVWINKSFKFVFKRDDVSYFKSVEDLIASDFDINSVDMIITDNHMGEMDGLSWLMSVHQVGYKHIPAILFSSDFEKVKLCESLDNVQGCNKDFDELQRLIMLIFSEVVEEFSAL